MVRPDGIPAEARPMPALAPRNAYQAPMQRPYAAAPMAARPAPPSRLVRTQRRAPMRLRVPTRRHAPPDRARPVVVVAAVAVEAAEIAANRLVTPA